jgi:hypothetical protein
MFKLGCRLQPNSAGMMNESGAKLAPGKAGGRWKVVHNKTDRRRRHVFFAAGIRS